VDLEIKPLVPTWPSRPTDKVIKEKEKPASEQKDAEEKEDTNDDDGPPHIDEYA